MKRNLSIFVATLVWLLHLESGLLCLKRKPESRRPACRPRCLKWTRCGRSRCRIIGSLE